MKNPLFDEDYIQDLPRVVHKNLQEQNEMIILIICNRIKNIGTLSASDAHRLGAAYYAGADMNKINSEISKITKLNMAEIDRIYEEVGKNNLEFAKASFEFRKIPYIPFEENAQMQSMVYAMSKITKGTYKNLSRTAGFISRDGVALDIRQQYIKVVDRAITSVSTGVTDYQSAMRGVIKEMSNSGCHTINYESGYSRRLDTAVRQNILTGIKDISQEMQHDIGQAVGADGYEISYHANPRPSHVDMGGQQYSTREFYSEGINDLLQDYNCYHFAFEIIMAINKPNWSREELLKKKAKDAEIVRIDKKRDDEYSKLLSDNSVKLTGEPLKDYRILNNKGLLQPPPYYNKEMNRYKWSQEQRKLETNIRKLKDEANAYKAAGDDLARRQTQSKINHVQAEYNKLSAAVGLSVQPKRVSVAGFNPVKVK